jgi:V8-like Glu-specific endopeptidase
MIELRSVNKPESAFEGLQAAPGVVATEGSSGSASSEYSRSLRDIAAVGKSPPIGSAFESLIGRDERVRILDTDLSPWRMICALRMQGPTGAGAIGTGWFIGPRTVLTAGHCVFSKEFFGGWAATIEVIPGLNGSGAGASARPFGSVVSTKFTTLNRWTEQEDPDYDFGCIHLDESKGDEVGWFSIAALPPADLQGYLVNVSGYPGDRGAGAEQYHSRNRVLSVSERRLFYEVDTFGGQSGAPVWIHEEEGGPPIAVGVHAYGIGSTPPDLGIVANSAPRFIPEVQAQLSSWIAQDEPRT